MFLNKKVKAYTLSELIIVIIITSIVAGLSFSVLNLVHSHMNQISRNFDYELKVKQAELKMTIDFNNYSKIYIAGDDKLVFKNYKDSLIYRLESGYFIQDRDTLDLAISDKAYFFRGNKVKRGNVDALEVIFRQSDKLKTRLFVYRKTDALNILNDGD